MNLEQAIRDYLPQIVHLSLGTSKDNKPWVCEVHFAYDDGLNLYFRSLASRRHSLEIATNPAVAGTIIKQHELTELPRGIYFEGTAQLLNQEKDQIQAASYLKERLQIPKDILLESKQPEGAQFYKITVNTWYLFGKLGDEGLKKYELKWH